MEGHSSTAGTLYPLWLNANFVSRDGLTGSYQMSPVITSPRRPETESQILLPPTAHCVRGARLHVAPRLCIFSSVGKNGREVDIPSYLRVDTSSSYYSVSLHCSNTTSSKSGWFGPRHSESMNSVPTQVRIDLSCHGPRSVLAHAPLGLTSSSIH